MFREDCKARPACQICHGFNFKAAMARKGKSINISVLVTSISMLDRVLVKILKCCLEMSAERQAIGRTPDNKTWPKFGFWHLSFLFSQNNVYLCSTRPSPRWGIQKTQSCSYLRFVLKYRTSIVKEIINHRRHHWARWFLSVSRRVVYISNEFCVNRIQDGIFVGQGLWSARYHPSFVQLQYWSSSSSIWRSARTYARIDLPMYLLTLVFRANEIQASLWRFIR